MSEPVAWRVKDFAGDWILYHDEDAARDQAYRTGALIQPLYAQLSDCHACALEQTRVDALKAENAELQKERDEMYDLLAQSKCPNTACDGQGTIVTEHLGEVFLEQCVWCDSVADVFSRRADRITKQHIAGDNAATATSGNNTGET